MKWEYNIGFDIKEVVILKANNVEGIVNAIWIDRNRHIQYNIEYVDSTKRIINDQWYDYEELIKK